MESLKIWQAGALFMGGALAACGSFAFMLLHLAMLGKI